MPISPGWKAASGKSGISGSLLNQLTQMDGFVHVVRCFTEANVPHPAGSVNPLRDIAAMDAELLLNDLIAVERKQERLAEERKKGGGRDRALIDREVALFEKLAASLAREEPLRMLDLSLEEERLLSGFGFLTRKPVLVLLNLSEGQDACQRWNMPTRAAGWLPCKASWKWISPSCLRMKPRLFMAEYGIQELGLLQGDPPLLRAVGLAIVLHGRGR